MGDTEVPLAALVLVPVGWAVSGTAIGGLWGSAAVEWRTVYPTSRP